MKIALTGATGFIGRYTARRLVASGHRLRCWYRPASDRDGFELMESAIEWVPGDLGVPAAAEALVQGCDAVVHTALFRPGAGFIGAEGNVVEFLQRNFLGTIRLIEAARAARVERFVFVSTCAVHDVILGDRPLDETHPLWPKSHYGAHKAALEAFVSSYGRGSGFGICALRPTGVYGLAHPVSQSRWFDLVGRVARGQDVTCTRGGKEVHVADVARAIEVLLNASLEKVTGEAFNCYDRYISDHDVATLAKDLGRSPSRILGRATVPKNQIATGKIRALGMEFGGGPLLVETVRELLRAYGKEDSVS